MFKTEIKYPTRTGHRQRQTFKQIRIVPLNAHMWSAVLPVSSTASIIPPSSRIFLHVST